MAWEYMGEAYGTDYDLAYAMVRGGYLEESFKAWVNDNMTAYEVLFDVVHADRARVVSYRIEREYATIVAENIEADVDEYVDDYGGVAVRIDDTDEEED